MPVSSAAAVNALRLRGGNQSTIEFDPAFAFGLTSLNTGAGAVTVPADISGVMPVPQLTRADAAFTLTNGTSAQAMFTAATDALTVVAGQSYRFRCAARLTTNVGSFFEAWPIGANPVTKIGAWA